MAPLHFRFIFFFSLLIIINGCENRGTTKAESYEPTFSADSLKQRTIVMGFPNFSYSETAESTIEYLNAHLSKTKIKVRACVNWDEYTRFLNQGKFDIILINGIVATEATAHGYSILGKITSNDPYSSLIITAKNSTITKLNDLKGKKIALVPANNIPATMMGMYYLHQKGLDVNLNIHKENVASFEAAILSVYLGKSDAGICARRNWNVYVKEHPEILQKVEVKWETPPLEHNAIVVKNSVDRKAVSELMKAFFSMHGKQDAKAALERLDITGFEKADINTYKPMMDFKQKYDKVIF